jgi:hypothetical protein
LYFVLPAISGFTMNSQENLLGSNSNWEETRDKSMANWRRVRASIEHENQLINYRLTWLLNFETVLVTAFAFFVKAIDSDVNKICVVSSKTTVCVEPAEWHYFALAGFVNIGIVSALYVERFIRGAENAHDAQILWWQKHGGNPPAGSNKCPIEITLDSPNPPLCGGPRPITSLGNNIVAKLMRQSRYPLVFVLAWLGFNYGVLFHYHRKLWPWSLRVALFFPALVLAAWIIIYSLQKEEHENYLDPYKEIRSNRKKSTSGDSAPDPNPTHNRNKYQGNNWIEQQLDGFESPNSEGSSVKVI